ncbi:MAG: FAD-dependent oxidoreductase [Planctomycetota bacterium]
MALGRRLVQEYVDFYRKYVDGCQNIELVTTAALMGVRETRRIVGEYELTFDDYGAGGRHCRRAGDPHKLSCLRHRYKGTRENTEATGSVSASK